MKQINFLKNIKESSFFIALFFVIIYVPLFFTIYSNSWYEFNYNYQDTYEILGYNKTINATNNLIGFFSHKNNLNNLWNKKEISHMNDVRNIYDFIFILYLLSIGIIILFYFKFKKNIKRYCKYNIYGLISLIFILPIFSFFWKFIFHPILFNNNLWLMNPNDISYYLFSLIDNSFFIRSFILILIISIIINLILIQIYKKK